VEVVKCSAYTLANTFNLAIEAQSRTNVDLNVNICTGVDNLQLGLNAVLWTNRTFVCLNNSRLKSITCR
jgi:hypothetical protein